MTVRNVRHTNHGQEEEEASDTLFLNVMLIQISPSFPSTEFLISLGIQWYTGKSGGRVSGGVGCFHSRDILALSLPLSPFITYDSTLVFLYFTWFLSPVYIQPLGLDLHLSDYKGIYILNLDFHCLDCKDTDISTFLV